MSYVFELLAIDPDGGRCVLETTKQRLKHKDLVPAHGESLMDNLLFNGRRATICVIEDQAGSVIGEVYAKARESATSGSSSPRALDEPNARARL
jgi:hypothetical protein